MSILKIVLWNAHGLRLKVADFSRFLSDHAPDIAFLTETWLQFGQPCCFPNYIIHRRDRPTRGGGVAICVRASIPHHLRALPTLRNTEAVAIRLTGLPVPLTVAAVYLPEHGPFQTGDLRTLLTSDARVLLAGDFNCRHRAWGCMSTNKRGMQLRRLLDSPHYGIHSPPEFTFIPYHPRFRPSVLDLFLSAGPVVVSGISVRTDLTSDHLPVIGYVQAALPLHSTRAPRYDFGRADWDAYRSSLDSRLSLAFSISTPSQLDAQVTHFTDAMLSAARHSIPDLPTTHLRGTPFPNYIRSYIIARNKARRHWQHSRSMADYQSFSFLRTMCRRLTSDWLAAEKVRKIRSLSYQSGSIWRFIRNLRSSTFIMPPLEGGGPRPCESPLEKAELLADHFHSTFRLFSTPGVPLLVPLHYTPPSPPGPTDIPLATPGEVRRLTQTIRLQTAPGPDAIHPRLVYSLSRKAIVYLTRIINSILILGHFPTSWKVAIVIPLPKPRVSPSLPANYRPISLLSVLSKVAERIILKRLEHHLTPLGPLPTFQFGFRRGLSAQHAVARVVDQITKGFTEFQHTGIILLDLSKAFDTVSHSALLTKLAYQGFPGPLIYLLYQFLSNRSFHVRIQSSLSQPRLVPAGVPQGAILSPLLFALYTSDIPIPPSCSVTMYADDTAITTSSRNIKDITSRLSVAISLIIPYFHSWGIRANAGKSQAAIFTRRFPRPPPPVVSQGEVIPWQPTIKYLGLTLDTSLRWTPHFQESVTKARQAMFALASVLKPSSPLPLEDRTRLYVIYVLTILLYGAPIWAHAAPTPLRILTVFHRLALRLLTGKRRWTPLPVLYDLTSLPSLQYYISRRATKFYTSLVRSKNPLVTSIADYDPTLPYPHKRLKDYPLLDYDPH